MLWLTLRPVYKQYRVTNEVIRGAARRFSWMTVVDLTIVWRISTVHIPELLDELCHLLVKYNRSQRVV